MTYEEIIKAEQESHAKFEAETFYNKYCVADLRKIFDGLTKDMANWKMPFDVPGLMGEEVMPVVTAIQYFTGDNPQVDLNVNTMRFCVRTRGYYGACGA